MFLLLDNVDSFTFNLVQAFQQLGADPLVMANDDPQLLAWATRPDLDLVCISPGPSRPEKAGLCLEFLARLRPTVPVLGVCLGHQILGHAGGGAVHVAQRIMHGKTSWVHHTATGLFAGLDNPLEVCRYHSLLVDVPPAGERLEVTARTDQGEVMGLAWRDRPWYGVQFHPESILTPGGPRLLDNFLSIAAACGEGGEAA